MNYSISDYVPPASSHVSVIGRLASAGYAAHHQASERERHVKGGERMDTIFCRSAAWRTAQQRISAWRAGRR